MMRIMIMIMIMIVMVMTVVIMELSLFQRFHHNTDRLCAVVVVIMEFSLFQRFHHNSDRACGAVGGPYPASAMSWKKKFERTLEMRNIGMEKKTVQSTSISME